MSELLLKPRSKSSKIGSTENWFNKIDVTKGIEKLSIFRAQMSNTLSPQTRLTSGGKDYTF